MVDLWLMASRVSINTDDLAFLALLLHSPVGIIIINICRSSSREPDVAKHAIACAVRVSIKWIQKSVNNVWHDWKMFPFGLDSTAIALRRIASALLWWHDASSTYPKHKWFVNDDPWTRDITMM